MTKAGVQSIDSIVGAEQSFQEMLEGLIEPIFSNIHIDFPNPMTIGDTFLDTKVTELPIKGMDSCIITTDTKYTLVSVAGNEAQLKTEINLKGDFKIMDKVFPLIGTGSGDMSIDLVEEYSTSSSTVINQEMVMEMQGMTMNQKVTSSVTTKTQKVK